jgi:pimeloyl-ACP methyl ester carboxylesterase
MAFRPLKSFFPTADELLKQELPMLGRILLIHLKSYEGLNTVYQHAGLNRGYLRAMLENRNVGLGPLPKEPEYGNRQLEVTDRMMEAWNWLEREGLLIHNDQQVADWFNISSEAEKLLTRSGIHQIDPNQRKSQETNVIVLVHGIRTTAEWQELVSDVMERVSSTLVVPVGYGYFDVLRFLLPGPTRRPPIDRIRRELAAIRATYPAARLSVIAHSFGTYIVSRILAEESQPIFWRIVFCGSIVPQGFRWDMSVHRIETRLINECGVRDIWPILAGAMTWGYGPSGTFGFRASNAMDRFHDFRHSDFFTRDFVEGFWKPFFVGEGTIERTAIVERPSPPAWHHLLAVTPLRWILMLLLVLSGAWAFRYDWRGDEFARLRTSKAETKAAAVFHQQAVSAGYRDAEVLDSWFGDFLFEHWISREVIVQAVARKSRANEPGDFAIAIWNDAASDNSAWTVYAGLTSPNVRPALQSPIVTIKTQGIEPQAGPHRENSAGLSVVGWAIVLGAYAKSYPEPGVDWICHNFAPRVAPFIDVRPASPALEQLEIRIGPSQCPSLKFWAVKGSSSASAFERFRAMINLPSISTKQEPEDTIYLSIARVADSHPLAVRASLLWLRRAEPLRPRD